MILVNFWQGRYESGETPWDLGGPSPHFEALLKQQPAFLKPGRMAVLGSGRGHDAALFARAGFEVVGFDYAPGAKAEATRLYGDRVRWEQADIFTLADPASPWHGQFDVVLEHTCFCAIAPSDRPRYAAAARNLLKPGGLLIGVFWENGESEGPPFNTTPADLQAIFGESFSPLSEESHPPAGGRSGQERLVILQRKPEPCAYAD